MDNKAPIAAEGKATEIGDADFDGMIGGNPYVIVDFWADWCAPCHALAPVLDDLAAEYRGHVVFLKVDAETNQVKARMYGIHGLPTLLFFKRGRHVESVVGSIPKAALKDTIQRLYNCGRPDCWARLLNSDSTGRR